VPNYITQVTVNFSAINYSAPDKVKFAYRIAEKGNNWNYTSQNFIQSFRLSPGTYTLQVKAANEDGVWSGTKQLQLIFMPLWYQTWAFDVAVIIAVMMLLYGLYLYRVKQILKVERIRQKLSSDLHDDIGSTLNSVGLFTKMAMMQHSKDEFLPQIKAGVQNAIESIRDIIWILDKEPETIESIFYRINAFCKPMAKAAGCAVLIDIEPQLVQHSLYGQEKQNIYLVIKEAVNNCIKYAACTTITMQVRQQGNQICISIIDDGKGFEMVAGQAEIAEGGSGHGLKNMRLRCAEIKWKLSITSAPGKGTSISLLGKFKG
jgi:signal transduction histidine kinase